MQRALLLLLALAGAGAQGEEGKGGDETPEEGDDAPFMLVVESAEGGQAVAAAALVSRRTAVTCAECARGAALAVRGARGATRRVARVSSPAGGAGGLAVLELETEFPVGEGAGDARPILMATVEGECGAAGALCHLVRALPQLLIVDAELAPAAACAAAAAPGADLCLVGPELCPSDRGTGVVCGGKLCGVVARSAGGAGQCGDTHAGYSLARRRKFVQCAHTLRQCGRGDCAEVCTERRVPVTSSAAASPVPPARVADPALLEPPHRAAAAREPPSRAPPAPAGWPPPRRTPPAAAPALSSAPGGGGLQWVARDYAEYGTDERQYVAPRPAPPAPPPPADVTRGGAQALTTDDEERALASRQPPPPPPPPAPSTGAPSPAPAPPRTKPSRKSATEGARLETVIDYELAREAAGQEGAPQRAGGEEDDTSSRAPFTSRTPHLLLASLLLLHCEL